MHAEAISTAERALELAPDEEKAEYEKDYLARLKKMVAEAQK